MTLKKTGFPFRLGTTSYIVPDEILPNIEFLAPMVDDVQLVLFESDEISNLPDADTIAGLLAWKERADLSYTVHLPLDARLGSADEEERGASVGKYRRVIELTRELDPHAWIAHLDGRRRGDEPAEDLDDWRAALATSLTGVLETGIDSRRLCVETLDYPLELVEGLIVGHDLSVCVDVGHLLLAGRDVGECMEAFAKRTRVVHLHGVRDGRDHVQIGTLEQTLVREVVERVARPGAGQRVLTLEVFSGEDFELSMEFMDVLKRKSK
jgi:sugar phosphate isomerase/epimerase